MLCVQFHLAKVDTLRFRQGSGLFYESTVFFFINDYIYFVQEQLDSKAIVSSIWKLPIFMQAPKPFEVHLFSSLRPQI